MLGSGIASAPLSGRSAAAIEPAGLGGRLSHAWLGTVAANAAIMLCGIATGILSARLLAPAGRGALAALLFWPQLIASLGLLSLPAAIIYRRGRPGSQRQSIAATGAWLALGLAAVCGLAGAVALPLLLPRATSSALAQIYLLAFLPFHFLALTLLALDQGDMRFGRYNLVRLLPSYVYLACLLILWALDAVSVAALVWATWLGTALTALARLYQARHALRARPSLFEARVLLALGTRFHGAALLAALFAQADRFVVLTFWDDASLGLYVVAATLAGAGLNVVAAGFNVILLPRLAAAASIEAQRQILSQTLRYAMLLLTAGTMILLLLCPWLVPFLFGHAFAGATGISIVLLLGYVPTALRQVITRWPLRHRRLAPADRSGKHDARRLRPLGLAAGKVVWPRGRAGLAAGRERRLAALSAHTPSRALGPTPTRLLGPRPSHGQGSLPPWRDPHRKGIEP